MEFSAHMVLNAASTTVTHAATKLYNLGVGCVNGIFIFTGMVVGFIYQADWSLLIDECALKLSWSLVFV